MHELGSHDPRRAIDWGKISQDYAAYRPGYPQNFFDRLLSLGVGQSGQRVLDLGTGTGNLARQFARQGCIVTGADISPDQIATAKKLALDEELDVDFIVRSSEDISFPDNSFDLITASQCWLYFDKSIVIPIVRKLLRQSGRLMTCHISWLPREDEVACQMEEMVLKYNPQWTASNWSGVVPEVPIWTKGYFKVENFVCYDEPIPFTHESWRGRIRACRGVGAALSPDEVNRFDKEYADMLARSLPDEFTVLHRIDAHILKPLA